MKECYEILGVSIDSTPEQIKKAFRKLAVKYHPDKNSDNDTTAKFQEISNAYQILTDPLANTIPCSLCYGIGIMVITRRMASVEQECVICKGTGRVIDEMS